jgi:D-alanine--poly(phosphoribitol) ligase subunit 1
MRTPTATTNGPRMLTSAAQNPRHTHRSLDMFFSASLQKWPDRAALCVSGKGWSYAEVDAESRQLERRLQAASLFGQWRNIGLLYGKSVYSYAAIIAIMRSNNVYVPLNPSLPTARLITIIQDAGIGVLIVDKEDALTATMINELRSAAPMHIMWISNQSGRELESSAAESGSSAAPIADQLARATSVPERLAYIIYTSGSTGIPKGVAISHDSACSCIEYIHYLTQTNEDDRFTQFSALSFDVSICDMFLCWKSGGALHVPTASEGLVPLGFVTTHGITVWSSVPSLANILLKLRLLTPNALPRLRLAMFAGEGLPYQLAQAWTHAAPQSRVLNLYGPTEVTIFATYHWYSTAASACMGILPIGRPFPGMRCLIVQDGQAVEQEDVTGELWMSGSQLAAGYWNNAAATEKAFVRYPPEAAAAEIWYRTGDVVSYRGDVGYLFHGRTDRQIKLHGHRVELQDIESALRAEIGCVLVAVVPIRNEGGMWEKLVAYCDRIDAEEPNIKSRCLKRLPRYMIPDRIVKLDQFPLGAHGKVDYLALAARSLVLMR